MAKKSKLTAHQRAQKKIQQDKQKADSIREQSLQSSKSKNNLEKFKNITPAQAEAWATKATKINPSPKAQGRKVNYRQLTGE